MRKFTHHSRPAFCNPFPLTSPFPKKRSPLSTLDTLPSFRLWMISSMLSASKPPRKHTHYENKILVWGPITELTPSESVASPFPKLLGEKPGQYATNTGRKG